MGLVKKPRVNDYWSKNPVMASSFAASLMSRDRFKMILAFFHLNNNNNYIPRGQPGHDPLHKVRTLLDSLNFAFKRVYIPTEWIALDEAVVPWRGRLIFRVYIKNKPTKWGIKLYMICESLSGYVYHFEVYCRHPEISNSTIAVVKRMLEESKLSNEGRTPLHGQLLPVSKPCQRPATRRYKQCWNQPFRPSGHTCRAEG